MQTLHALCCSVFVLSVMTAGQAGPITHLIPLMPTQSGVLYGGGSSDAAVKVEVFVDLLCPISKSVWSSVKEAASKFQPTEVSVRVHQFPLPYHQFALVLSQGFLLVKDKKPEKLWDYMDEVFRKQHLFTNTATHHHSLAHVIGQLAELIELETGIPKSFVKENVQTYHQIRQAWKYAVRRGVAGTPWFFVNGVEMTLNENLSVKDWINFINGLLNANVTPATDEKQVNDEEDPGTETDKKQFTSTKDTVRRSEGRPQTPKTEGKTESGKEPVREQHKERPCTHRCTRRHPHRKGLNRRNPRHLMHNSRSANAQSDDERSFKKGSYPNKGFASRGRPRRFNLERLFGMEG